MRYLALLYGKESEAWGPGTAAHDDEVAGYERFADLAGKAILAGEALERAATAVTVRSVDGKRLVLDGPYAETTEVVGGMLVLEAGDLDEAIDLARRVPAAADGAVELRPLVEWFERPTEAHATEGAGRYLALLHEPPSDADVPGTRAWEEAAAAHGRFGEAAGASLLAGAALHPADTATTVRVREGEVVVTDGPFAETTEVIGGLYLLQALDVEEAVAVAKRIPVAAGGGVEVRPVMEL